MVGPSTTPEERQAQRRLVYGSFVLVVGGSAGLIALQADASLLEIGVVVLVGLAVGFLLTWYLVSMTRF